MPAASGLVLPSTPGDEQGAHPRRARRARGRRLDQRRRGHPAGLSGRRDDNFIQGGVNRVILATDGDFNVGVTSQSDLVRLIEQKREERRVPDRARLRHGQPQGLDDGEARRQGQRQLRLHRFTARGAQGAGARRWRGTLVTIAKDVKIQVEFNPARGRRLPPDRLREPPARAPRTSTTTRRTPARSARATR